MKKHPLSKSNRRLKIVGTAVVALSMVSLTAFAAGSAQNMSIATVATSITSTFGSLARLITAGSYIAGIGFAVSSIFKFKQHKDNPQQTQIGTPIALLFIAAALLFLPNILTVAGQTVFGTQKQSGGVTGTIPSWKG